jgi:hypothetical protein
LQGPPSIQRLLYLHIGSYRILFLIQLLYEAGLILWLVFATSAPNAVDTVVFLFFLTPHLELELVSRQIDVVGGTGFDNSDNGFVAFEAGFRNQVKTGLLMAQRAQQRVQSIDKSGKLSTMQSELLSLAYTDKFDGEDSTYTILGQAATRAPRQGILTRKGRSAQIAPGLVAEENNVWWILDSTHKPANKLRRLVPVGICENDGERLKLQTPVKAWRPSYFQ